MRMIIMVRIIILTLIIIETSIEELKIYLPCYVASKFSKMEMQFRDTFSEVGSIMKSNPQPPSVDGIKYVVGTYNKALVHKITYCQDIGGIMHFLWVNGSFDDTGLLEFLVNVFNIKEAKPVIKEYKEEFEELKMELSQCLKIQLSNTSPLECESITIVVDKDVHHTSYKDIKRLSSSVLFGKLSQHVRLNIIRGDSGMIHAAYLSGK